MSKRKTKIMCNYIARRKQIKGIKVDGEKLEENDEQKYLGKVLTPRNEISIEINQRVNAGWKRFSQYSRFLKEKSSQQFEEKNHEHCHFTIIDLWIRNMGAYNTSVEKTSSHTEKYGKKHL